ncbi:dynein axonemal heavy chain 1-like [Petromyzon marinus]|uniref:dynein axonemal heavy chain 1-like n=1 Tax=Petromyzon marinus TaxID=7757 RepID=UPI003F72ACAF
MMVATIAMAMFSMVEMTTVVVTVTLKTAMTTMAVVTERGHGHGDDGEAVSYRRRREFQSQRLESLLSEAGVEATTPLLPVAPRAVYRAVRGAGSRGYPPFLPLEVFDDEESECRTPEEWLSLGLDSESGIRKPVPARAFLPLDEKSKSAMSWVSVGVLDYDHSTRLYLVQRADANGRVRLAPKGDPPHRAWLPRVLVAFHAEDPRRFAARVARAVASRRDAQVALLHCLALDCVPQPRPSSPRPPTAAGMGVAAEGGGGGGGGGLDGEMRARVTSRVGALVGRAG